MLLAAYLSPARVTRLTPSLETPAANKYFSIAGANLVCSFGLFNAAPIVLAVAVAASIPSSAKTLVMDLSSCLAGAVTIFPPNLKVIASIAAIVVPFIRPFLAASPLKPSEFITVRMLLASFMLAPCSCNNSITLPPVSVAIVPKLMPTINPVVAVTATPGPVYAVATAAVPAPTTPNPSDGYQFARFSIMTYDNPLGSVAISLAISPKAPTEGQKPSVRSNFPSFACSSAKNSLTYSGLDESL